MPYHYTKHNTHNTTSQLSPILPSKPCNKLQHHKPILHCRSPVGTTLLATSDRKINNRFKTRNIFCYRGALLRSWLGHCAKPAKFWVSFLILVSGIFHFYKSSGRSIRPLTEIFPGLGGATACAECLEIWDP
jgi:hypothetical protein